MPATGPRAQPLPPPGKRSADKPEPLVSVMTPCFLHARTLPEALCSLQLQTYAHWECVVVDDGSPQDIAAIVKAMGDARFRYVRLQENRGRGAARQRALERCEGQYLCMLDADDWIYPDKIARQVAVLEAYPELGICAARAAVMDEQGQLCGMRRSLEMPGAYLWQLHGHPHPPGLLFGAMMLRMELARQGRFDPRLRRSEDFDYLWDLLPRTHVGVLNQALYVYRQNWSPQAMRQAIASLDCQARALVRRSAPGEPWAKEALGLLAGVAARGLVYRAAEVAGAGPWLFARRNRPATPEEREAFAVARNAVLARCRELGFT